MDQKTTMHVEFQTDTLDADQELRERIRLAVRDVLLLHDSASGVGRGDTQHDVMFTNGWMEPEVKNQAKLEALAEELDRDAEPEIVLPAVTSLADAVETVLEESPPQLDEFEGLIRTLQSFDSMVTDQLIRPASTVERPDWSPSTEELEEFEDSTIVQGIQGLEFNPWK